MQFVGELMGDDDFFGPKIKFVTIEELFEIAIQNMKDGTESKLKLHEMMKKYLEEKKVCQDRLEKDGTWDSSGALLF